MSRQFPLLTEFIRFITERWDVHVRRQSGLPAPWTKDSILQTYRFTNVRREDDRVTKWIHANWLRPNARDPDLWFALYMSRVFNQPSTLVHVGYPVPYTVAVRRRLHTLPEGRVFNAAYMVSTNGVAMGKLDYYSALFDLLWRDRKNVCPVHGDVLETFFQRITQYKGIASFMGAQIVADLKWAPVLRHASDWSTFAHSGPGSRRGLNRVAGREVRKGWNEAEWVGTLLDLRTVVLPRLPTELKNLDAQNIQNCLCEFDKYSRVVEGVGRPKQLFKPFGGVM